MSEEESVLRKIFHPTRKEIKARRRKLRKLQSSPKVLLGPRNEDTFARLCGVRNDYDLKVGQLNNCGSI
jgi:hypothetical protein